MKKQIILTKWYKIFLLKLVIRILRKFFKNYVHIEFKNGRIVWYEFMWSHELDLELFPDRTKINKIMY